MASREKTGLPERAAWIVAWLAIVTGAGVRLWAVSQRGSLWLDEAALALNVLTRSVGELTQPLDWGQAAAVGFLWIERAVSFHADAPEPWLRLVPWCAGAALPWLLWLLGKRIIGTGAGALAAVAAAGSLLAMRYSTEAKPYAVDAAMTAALLLLARNAADDPERMRDWWALGALTMLAVLVSLPAVFVVAGLCVVLLRDRGVRASRGARVVGVPALVVAAALFVFFWRTSYAAGASNGALRAYWAPVMLTVSAPDIVVRVLRVFMELTWIPLRWTGSLAGTVLALALWGGGLALIAVRRRGDALLLSLPIAFAAAASIVGAYPLSDRLAFFAVPAVWIAQSAALIGARNLLLTSRNQVANERTAAVFVVLVSVSLATWQYTDAERFLRDPGALESTRALFQEVDREAASAPIYVYARSAPAWLIATHDGEWGGDARINRWRALAGRSTAPGYENGGRTGAVPVGSGDSLQVVSGARTELVGLSSGVVYRIAGPPSRAGPSEGWAAEEARRMLAAAKPEVWLVASHFFAGSPYNELRPLVAAIEAAGLRIIEERHAGSDVVALRITR